MSVDLVPGFKVRMLQLACKANVFCYAGDRMYAAGTAGMVCKVFCKVSHSVRHDFGLKTEGMAL